MTAFHVKVQCCCCIVDDTSHMTASTPLSRVYCRIPWQSTGRLYHNCCRIVDVASHMTASTSTDASIAAFHARVQTVCTIIAAGIPKSSDTFTLCTRHAGVFVGSTYSSSLLFQTNILPNLHRHVDVGGVCQVVSICFYLYFIPLSLLLAVPTLCILPNLHTQIYTRRIFFHMSSCFSMLFQSFPFYLYFIALSLLLVTPTVFST